MRRRRCRRSRERRCSASLRTVATDTDVPKRSGAGEPHDVEARSVELGVDDGSDRRVAADDVDRVGRAGRRAPVRRCRRCGRRRHRHDPLDFGQGRRVERSPGVVSSSGAVKSLPSGPALIASGNVYAAVRMTFLAVWAVANSWLEIAMAVPMRSPPASRVTGLRSWQRPGRRPPRSR